MPTIDLRSSHFADFAYEMVDLFQSSPPKWSYAIIIRGSSIVSGKLPSAGATSGAALGSAQVKAAQAFARVVLEDLLGSSKAAQPFIESTIVPLTGEIVRQGSVQVSRSDMAAYVRQMNPNMPPALASALSLGYLGYSSGGRSNAPHAEAFVDGRVDALHPADPINWGYSGSGPRAFSEVILRNVRQSAEGFKPQARFNYDAETLFMQEFLSRYDNRASSVWISGADVVGFALDRLPHLFLGGPQADLRTEGQRNALAFRSLERTTLGEVRRHAHAGGFKEFSVGERWLSTADMSYYSVLAVVDDSAVLTLYAGERGFRAGGPAATGGQDLPASMPVLVLGRIPLEQHRTQWTEPAADVTWATSLIQSKGVSDLDALIRECGLRSLQRETTAAHWSEQSPYPYDVGIRNFESTHLQFAEGQFVQALGDNWRDTNGTRYHLRWSEGDGYLYALQTRPDGTPINSPMVRVLGRFVSAAARDEALADTAHLEGTEGGLEELSTAIAPHLLRKQSPSYAFGTRGPRSAEPIPDLTGKPAANHLGGGGLSV